MLSYCSALLLHDNSRAEQHRIIGKWRFTVVKRDPPSHLLADAHERGQVHLVLSHLDGGFGTSKHMSGSQR